VPDVIDALIAATAITYFARGRTDLLNIRDTAVLILFGAGLAAGVTATVGITVVIVANHLPWSVFGINWVTWWLGDVSGIILMAPLIVAIARAPRTRLVAHRVAEAVFLAGLVALASSATFTGILGSAFTEPAEYLIFALLTWTAFRFGPRLTLVAVNLVAIIAVAAAYSHRAVHPRRLAWDTALPAGSHERAGRGGPDPGPRSSTNA
jgi:integral membrane sensor domain MASE1